jgi:hypothetical protein
MLIGGTQIVPESGVESYHHFIFDNQSEADIQFKTNVSNCSYIIYKNLQRKTIGIKARSKICRNFYE